MLKRVVLGTAALLATASCVAPALPPANPRLVAAAGPAPSVAPVAIPAGPSPLYLVPPPSTAARLDDPIAQAPPFLAAAGSDDARRALDCLTAAVYYEARSEPLDGQRAVAQVVLNRVRNPAFPGSVCGVVYEGAARQTGCQFTFTCDGAMAARREPAAWERAREVAQAALDGAVFAPIGAATYYHAISVLPYWASSLTRVARIGAHIFYRFGGGWGSTLNFRQRYAGIEPIRAWQAAPPADAAPAMLDEVSAGVTIHRGEHPATEALHVVSSESFGVHIHRVEADAAS